MPVKMYPSQHKVKITVVKKTLNEDLIEKYTDTGDWGMCSVFEEGQEFIVSENTPWQAPEGFCGWAWGDIVQRVWGMARGGPNVFVTCCTDGYRPVMFLLEKLPAEESTPEAGCPLPADQES